MKTQLITTKQLAKAVDALRKGEVIAFPTETVMGLGVYYDDYSAYVRLNQIKRRPEDKPYTLMLADINEIDKYAHLTLRDRRIINAFMPGPITLLLKAKESVPEYVTHGTGIIGIRVPNMKVIQEMIGFAGKPLLVPSANRSGEKPFNRYEEVENEFKDELGFILHEDSLGAEPSTIVDLTEKDIRIIREGSLSLMDIERKIAMMKVAIGSDHGGYLYKEAIKEHLLGQGCNVIDVGTYSLESCHYPVFAAEVAKKVASEEAEFGIVVCTSGEGVMITANKVKGVRCGMGYNDEVSRLMREHNNANVISFGQKFMALEDVIRRVDIFLSTPFAGGRHQIRVDLISDLEK